MEFKKKCPICQGPMAEGNKFCSIGCERKKDQESNIEVETVK